MHGGGHASVFICMEGDGASELVGGTANLVVCQHVLTWTLVNVRGREEEVEKKAETETNYIFYSSF